MKTKEGTYVFRRATPEEVDLVFGLILDRMAWMDRVGINQWNKTRYVERFPLSYYRDHQQKGNLFVLVDSATSRIDCVAVLKEEDDRWNYEPTPSYYLHNFASREGTPGSGSLFLEECEKFASRMGKKYFRLDCAVNNPVLNEYYDKRGYSVVGTCTDGLYRGLLRQKEM